MTFGLKDRLRLNLIIYQYLPTSQAIVRCVAKVAVYAIFFSPNNKAAATNIFSGSSFNIMIFCLYNI